MQHHKHRLFVLPPLDRAPQERPPQEVPPRRQPPAPQLRVHRHDLVSRPGNPDSLRPVLPVNRPLRIDQPGLHLSRDKRLRVPHKLRRDQPGLPPQVSRRVLRHLERLLHGQHRRRALVPPGHRPQQVNRPPAHRGRLSPVSGRLLLRRLVLLAPRSLVHRNPRPRVLRRRPPVLPRVRPHRPSRMVCRRSVKSDWPPNSGRNALSAGSRWDGTGVRFELD